MVRVGRAAEAVATLLTEGFFTERLHPRDRVGKFRKSLGSYKRVVGPVAAVAGRADPGIGGKSSAKPVSMHRDAVIGQRASRVLAEFHNLSQEEASKLSEDELGAIEHAMGNALTTSHYEQGLRQKITAARSAKRR